MKLAQENGDGEDGGMGMGIRERLADYEPGQNIPDFGSYHLPDMAQGMMPNMDGEMMPDMGQGDMMGVSVPDSPGPAALGRTPLIGSVRRSRDMPVLRDSLMDATA
jgi:hypothetical protein